MKIDVFISHSSKDEIIANEICESFERNGIKCWIAPRNITPGSDWAESINTAIKNSSVMVLVFSENSNNSTQVAKELNLAINNKLVILPFKIDQSTPTGSMEYYLSDTHWLQVSGQNITSEITALNEVVVSALAHTPVETIPSKEEKVVEAKKHINKKTVGVIVAILALVALSVSVFFFNNSNEPWDCFVEKYSTENNMIVGGEEAIKKERLSDIDNSFGLIHCVEIKNDDIASAINLDQEQEVEVKIKSNIKPTAITYLCGNNGPNGTISGEDVPYEKDVSIITIPTFPRSSDGYSSGDRYRIRIVVAFEEKISLKRYEVEKFYFDKNVKVK